MKLWFETKLEKFGGPPVEKHWTVNNTNTFLVSPEKDEIKISCYTKLKTLMSTLIYNDLNFYS